MGKIEDVLEFWFGSLERPIEAEQQEKWFTKDPEFDDQIRERFGDDLERATRGEYDKWAETARGRLALIIVLDQFSRNLFRGSPRSWTQDLLAQKLTLEGLELGHDRRLRTAERVFFYMPLEHAEDLHLQELSVEKFEELAEEVDDDGGDDPGWLEYAVRHHEIIERFGRFPHRNEVLSRPTTDEEAAFLKEPNSSF
ncbi:MAG: DUF924 family protein [Persicimonas sp.]